ncbi:MAG: hypothetical protein M0R80_19300 [Proteobacteria bacterium]|jgi:hypothetical protein|nr:hypothetical protein [Pseudomonadota bacterium]
MKIEQVPFTTIDWSQVPKVEHPGERGTSHRRSFEMGNIRVRMVEYGPGCSCQVADGAAPHRSVTEKGATLFVVD